MMEGISPDIEVTMKFLKANNFDVQFAWTSDEAKKFMLEMIPLSALIGVGDSTTLRQIGILEELDKRGNELINPFALDLVQRLAKDPSSIKLFLELARKIFNTDIFLTSCNAVTEDGKLVSIDRVGNRVGGTIFGPKQVILPIGKNKLVKNVEEAIHRVKNVIAPAHAKRKGRKTPCAFTGRCTDCDSRDRICNITVIVEKKPLFTDFSVILINEDLGLGWDPIWDGNRIHTISDNYYRNSWS